MLFILVISSLYCVHVVGDSDDQQIIFAVQEPERAPCSRIGITGYPDHYVELAGTKWQLFKCAKFFVFDEQACGCVFKLPDSIPVIPFLPIMPETVSPETPTTYLSVTTTSSTSTPLPSTAMKLSTSTNRRTVPSTTTERTTKPTTTTARPTTTPQHTTTEPSSTTLTTTTSTRKTTTTTSYPNVKCKKIPHLENPSKYKEEVIGHGLVDRRCPAGTIFSKESCECEVDTRPKKKKKGLCDGCRFDRGVGYNEHFDRCDKYIICYPDAKNQSKLIGVMRQCDVGEYWDQELMTCISSTKAYCEFDPCSLNRTLTMYAYEGNCRGYWVCRYGVSIGQCCPQGQAFKTGIGCVQDFFCTSPCRHTATKVDKCDKIYVRNQPFLFQQMIDGYGYVTMRCAAGTVFNQTLCECETDNRPKSDIACTKEVEMNFTESVTTTIENRVHVAAVNVTHENGNACFYGDSALVIPRFSNAIIGKHLEIRIKYKMRKLSNSQKTEQLQALVYNGDCGPDASISVTVTPSRTVFGLRNDLNQSSILEVKSGNQNYRWKYAKFSLENEIMTLEENGYRKQSRFSGSISKSICGLKIGWGKGFESFKGCLNQLSISFCPS